MIMDKARIDRRHAYQEDYERQHWQEILRRIQAELKEGETPGEPFRASIGIIIPIEVHKPEHTPIRWPNDEPPTARPS